MEREYFSSAVAVLQARTRIKTSFAFSKKTDRRGGGQWWMRDVGGGGGGVPDRMTL